MLTIVGRIGCYVGCILLSFRAGITDPEAADVASLLLLSIIPPVCAKNEEN